MSEEKPLVHFQRGGTAYVAIGYRVAGSWPNYRAEIDCVERDSGMACASICITEDDAFPLSGNDAGREFIVKIIDEMHALHDAWAAANQLVKHSVSLV